MKTSPPHHASRAGCGARARRGSAVQMTGLHQPGPWDMAGGTAGTPQPAGSTRYRYFPSAPPPGEGFSSKTAKPEILGHCPEWHCGEACARDAHILELTKHLAAVIASHQADLVADLLPKVRVSPVLRHQRIAAHRRDDEISCGPVLVINGDQVLASALI